LTQEPPQLLCPEAQLHAPALHVLPPVHAFPHLPQLLGSVEVVTQVPLQLVVPSWQTQVVPLQKKSPVHVLGQVTVPLHPSDAVPHCCPVQACAAVFGVHWHVVPLQMYGSVHVLGQVTVPLHPSDAVPHCCPVQACAAVFGVHWHVPGVVVLLHTNGDVHPGAQGSVLHPSVAREPHVKPIGQLVGHIVLEHVPVLVHVSGAVHPGVQATMLPHPSGA
jgi:hypothetical protein